MFCRIEQWLARWAHNPEVGGSNPAAALKVEFKKKI